MRSKLAMAFIVIFGFILWSLFTAKSARAGCSGGPVYCGHVSCAAWSCTQPGYSCSETGEDCGTWGICECDATGDCVGDQGPKNCNAACNVISTCDDGSATHCVESGSCNYCSDSCGNYGACYAIGQTCYHSGSTGCGDDCYEEISCGCSNDSCPIQCGYDGGWVHNGIVDANCACGAKWCDAQPECSSCTITPAGVDVDMGESANSNATYTVTNGWLDNVTFDSDNWGIASVTTYDGGDPFDSTVTGVDNGDTTLRATGHMNTGVTCDGSANIHVNDVGCTVTINDITVNTDNTVTVTATTTVAGGTITNVTFSSDNTNVATITPSSDPTSPYQTAVTGHSGGTSTLTATCTMNTGNTGQDTATITVPLACTITATPTCSQNGSQIDSHWQVTSRNFNIVAIQGRFNKYPVNDWFNGPGGDQSLNWGTADSGDRSTDITGNWNYSASVGAWAQQIGGNPPNGYVCRSTPIDPINCSIIPNCKNLTGPPGNIIELGDTGTFTATYENGSAVITAGGLAVYHQGQCEPDPAVFYSQPPGGVPGNLSFDWTPAALGTYDVDCRAWNDGIAECRGRCYNIDPWYAYQCPGNDGNGGTTHMTVTVIPPVPKCHVNNVSANPSSIRVTEQSAISANLTYEDGTIQNVNFTASPNGKVTLNNPPVENPPGTYSELVTAIATANPVTITVTGTMNGGNTCQGTVDLTITDWFPWWQVKDADVSTNGDLNSSVSPTATLPYFDDKGDGGFAGIPAYGGSTDLTYDNVSETQHWKANSSFNDQKRYDFEYFDNAIPSDVTPYQVGPVITAATIGIGGSPIHGYYWYEYNANTYGGQDLNINGDINLANRRVVLIVRDANARLNGEINLNDGRGFFLLVTNHDIIVHPTVGGDGAANLEGIFVSDGQFSTGTSAYQLWVRGTVVAYGDILLTGQRDLGAANNTTPAEIFEFAPDLVLHFPNVLGIRKMAWQEVAP